jgi:hypothetical protein
VDLAEDDGLVGEVGHEHGRWAASIALLLLTARLHVDGIRIRRHPKGHPEALLAIREPLATLPQLH